MKKLIIFIIITIIVSGAVCAAENKSYLKAFNAANAMGILQSDKNPNSTLTRAEAAVIVCRMLGLTYANIKANPSFADVPETHWAYGAIHLLNHSGILTGISDNTFSPNAEITFDQFIKMLVTALKYDSFSGKARYLQTAIELNIFANGEQSQTLTKAFAAHLVLNAMNVNLLLYENPFRSGYSILQQKNVTEVTGKIASVAPDYFVLSLSNIKIQAENTPYNKAVSASNENYALASSMKILTATSLSPSMLGKECVAYIYSPFYVPQLKYIAADDFFTAMEVDAIKSEKIKTAKIKLPVSYHLYEQIGEFSNGYAVVKKDGKYGVVDEKWAEVIQPQFDALGDYAENLFPVKIDGKMGYINTKGKAAIPCAWTFCSSFSDGAAAVITPDGKHGLINKYGKFILNPTYDSLVLIEKGLYFAGLNGKYGVASSKGKLHVPLKYDSITYMGNMIISATLKQKTTYLKTDGSMAFENKWDEVMQFSGGYAAVRKGDTWGAINEKGISVISPEYEAPVIFKNGLAVAQKNKLQGVIDIKNNFIVKADRLPLEILDGYIQYTSNLTGLSGLMDMNGNKITEELFKSIEGVSEKRVLGVLFDGKTGYLDTDMVFKYAYTFKITKIDDRGFYINKERNYGFLEW